jgi:hypothetical protein
MANTLNILERTLAQASESTNAVHTIGTANGRFYVYEPLVIRITDSEYDTGGTGKETDKMALFLSKRHGEPFVLGGNKDMATKHIVIKADADPVTNATPVDVTVLFPNFDYSTFE